ncbi:hypothetical protein [Rhodococcus jostii]|uniref:hypothetical protein n=1 Tax=Rhodococcus jostii TaxID=132919 RepID=UPI001ED94EFA|nr:hypothetical protein [Rhodococcus jostii]
MTAEGPRPQRDTDAAATPPLGEILTADEIARSVARVAYPTSPVVLVDEELALAAPARAYGDWPDALACRIWPRSPARFCRRPPAAARRATLKPDPARSDHPGSVPGRRHLKGEMVRV